MSTKSVPVRFISESPSSTGPSTLEVAGVDISRLSQSVEIRASVGEISKVKVDMFALGGLDITLPAEVTVNILSVEEGWIDVTTMGDGKIRYEHRVRKNVP